MKAIAKFAAFLLLATGCSTTVTTTPAPAGTLVTPAMQKQRERWVRFPPTPPQRGYGIGIGINNGWIRHEGGLPGYNTGGYYLPSKRCALVILVNSDIDPKQGSLVSTLFQALAKILTPNNVPL